MTMAHPLPTRPIILVGSQSIMPPSAAQIVRICSQASYLSLLHQKAHMVCHGAPIDVTSVYSSCAYFHSSWSFATASGQIMSAEQEVASLDRVLLRLGSTPEASLEQVLSKLLPIVIKQLQSAHPQTRKKVLELLSHVNKRIKGQMSIKLPLGDLLDMYLASEAAPLVRNFALVYVEMAMERSMGEQQMEQVPKLLRGIAGQSPQHREMLLRMAFSGLVGLATMPRQDAVGNEETFAGKHPFLAQPADRAAFLDFALKMLLHQPPSLLVTESSANERTGITPFSRQFEEFTTTRRLPPAQASAALQQAEQRRKEQGRPSVAQGLCLKDVKALEGKTPLSALDLQQRKLGFLNFTQAAGMEPQLVVVHYLVAAVDPQDAVSRRGDELLRKRCGLDSPKPAVDLESPALMQRLFAVFFGGDAYKGTWPSTADPQQFLQHLEDQVAAEQREVNMEEADGGAPVVDETLVAPAGTPLRVRLMSLFCKSVAAANIFPGALETVMVCLDNRGVRLRQQGMEFAVWMFRHAETAYLQKCSLLLLSSLQGILNREAGSSDINSQTLRGFTYQALGMLASRVPEPFRENVDAAAGFFAALSSEPPGVRASLQEAVSTLATAYKGCSGEAAAQVAALLLQSIHSREEAARLCAVQWARRLYPFSHVPARYICILGAGDAKLEVREEAMLGLQPPKPGPGAPAVDAEASAWPSPQAMVAFLHQQYPRLPATAQEPRGSLDTTRPLLLEHKAFVALIKFLRECWKQAGRLGAEAETLPDAAPMLAADYLAILENALVKDNTRELQVAATSALLEAAAQNPERFAGLYNDRLSWLRTLLLHTDGTARDMAAKLVGITASALTAEAAQALLEDIVASFSDGDLKKHKFEEQDGVMAAAGYILAQSLTGSPSVAQHCKAQVATALCQGLQAPTAGLAASSAAALGHAGLRGPLPLPPGTQPPRAAAASGAAGDGSSAAGPAPGGSSAAEGAAGEPAKGPDSRPGHEQPAEATQQLVLARLGALLRHKDAKAVQRAATALGHLAAGARASAILEPALDSLLSLSASKDEDILFTAGEALCFAFGGVPVSADTVLRSNFQTLADWVHEHQRQEDPDGQAVPMSVEGSAAETGGGGAMDVDQAGEGDLSIAQQFIIAKVLEELVFDSKQEVRRAGCIWLLSLISYTGRHQRLLPLLPTIQDAFSHLLGDRDELTQEMASKGMSVVYSLGDEDTRKQLLDGLMGTLQGGTKKRRAVKLSGESRVFEEGSLGEAPGGGSISTYRELCSLATDMGQPDLVYRFMDLANHQASLNSSRGAAFGFAGIARLAGKQLEPYVAQMVPKLYRLQYDPNPRVRDSMTAIWRALVAEPRKAVDEHYNAIMKELLKEMGGRLWRNREASCLAMSDLLQGRRWPQLKSQFEELWSITLRALDDIKESVRAAAATLLRSVRGLTLRLCDPAATPAADAAEATAVALPLLLQKGLGSQVADVRALAIMTLTKLVQAGGPAQMQPHLADLTVAMLESLSGMEDTRLNYVEQHAARIGLDSERLESARVSASRSSPMGDTLDLCSRYADAASLPALIPRLSALVKRGTGLNTRVGTARFIVSLALRLGTELRPHSGALIKALMQAAAAERSAAVRKAYAQAAASVAKTAPEARAAKMVQEAVDMYREPGDREARLLSGLLLRELLRSGPDVFAGQAAASLPLAFLAQADEDKEVAQQWGEVWEEGTVSAAGALRLYMGEVVPLVLAGLTSAQWGQKRAAARGTVALAEQGPDLLAQHAPQLAAALLQELPGRLWEGKEDLLAALAALVKAAPEALTGQGGAPDTAAAIAALAAAAMRKRQPFRKSALSALQTALKAVPTQDHFERVAGPLLEACQASSAPPSSTPASSGAAQEAGESEEDSRLPVLESVQCLAAAWQGAGLATVASRGNDLAQALAQAMSPEQPWNVKVAALEAAKSFVHKLRGLNADTLAQQHLDWSAAMLPGICTAARDAQIAQVRTSALDAVTELLQATRQGAGMNLLHQSQIRQLLEEMVKSDRSAIVKAHAATVLGTLRD